MQQQINTERLQLKLLDLNDHDFIISILNTEGWIKFIGDRDVHSKEDALAYINKIMSNPNIFYWVARIKENNQPIGILSFIKRAYLDHFDIGFAFLPEFNGQGYASEAAKELLLIAGNASYYPILATTIPQNQPSIKLLTRLGFCFEKEIEAENTVLHVYNNAVN